MLQLLINLKFHALGKEITDADILNWANSKVKSVGRKSQIESFKVMNKTMKPASISLYCMTSEVYCFVRTKVYRVGNSFSSF